MSTNRQLSGVGRLKTLRRRFLAQGGFTLIEMVLAASLGLAVLTAAGTFLVQGMRFFERASSLTVSDEVGFFYERVTRDLRSAAVSATHPFSSDQTTMTLVTYVSDASGAGAQNAVPALVSYRWDSGTKKLMRTQRVLSGPGVKSWEQTVLSDVEGFRIVRKEEARPLPSRVSVFVDLDRNGRLTCFKKHITLLSGYALSS